MNYGNWNFHTIEYQSLIKENTTKDQLQKLLAIGYNPSPSMTNIVIRNDHILGSNLRNLLMQKYGPTLQNLLTQDTWFKVTEQPFFRYSTGTRMSKCSKIGSGGFGSVFKATLRNSSNLIAVKTIDITETYKMLF